MNMESNCCISDGSSPCGPFTDLQADIDRLTADNERLRAALEFYADESRYSEDGQIINGLSRPIIRDRGKLARAALSPSSDTEPKP